MTKIVAGLAGAESAPARDRTGQPTGENHQPQNAILSKFETPRRSCGGSVGEWLSLVEHLVRDQGVGGSNPLSPTNYLNPIIELACFRFFQFRQLESTWV